MYLNNSSWFKRLKINSFIRIVYILYEKLSFRSWYEWISVQLELICGGDFKRVHIFIRFKIACNAYRYYLFYYYNILFTSWRIWDCSSTCHFIYCLLVFRSKSGQYCEKKIVFFTFSLFLITYRYSLNF